MNIIEDGQIDSVYNHMSILSQWIDCVLRGLLVITQRLCWPHYSGQSELEVGYRPCECCE